MVKRIIALLLAVFCFSQAGAQSYIGSGGSVPSKPGMTLPDTIHVAIDRQMNIYGAQLAVSPFGGYPFYFNFDTDAGDVAERSLQWTPSAAANGALTIEAIDPAGKIVESRSVVLDGVSTSSGAGLKKIVFFGDSMLGQNDGVTYIIGEVDSLFSIDYAALGGADAVPVGVNTYGGYYHEAVSGWIWERYLTGYIAAGDTNRFWDHFTTDSRLDFQKYSEGYLGGMDLDYMVVHLGGNEAKTFAELHGRMGASDVDAVIDYAKAFSDTLANATYGYPNCKLILMTMPANGWKSAFNAAYGDEGWLGDYLYNIRAITKAYYTAFSNGAYASNVDVCASGLWVDSIYGYPTASTAYADRISDSLEYGTDFLHPGSTGRLQLADAVYSHLRFEIDEAAGGCTNELADSWQFGTAAWTDMSTYWTDTGSQTDPWGGTDATLFECVDNALAANTRPASLITLPADDIVASVFVYDGGMTSGERTRVRIWNAEIGTSTYADITWGTTPAAVVGTGADDGDIIDRSADLGSGWWQVWVYRDCSGITDRTGVQVNLYPSAVTPIVGDKVICAGVQLEYGVTSPCGTYVETP